MKKLVAIGCLGVLIMGCSTMEHRSEVIPKKPLEPITQQVAIHSLWEVNTGKGVGQSDLKLNLGHTAKTLFTTDYRGKLKAIAKDSGETLWTRDLESTVTAGPVASKQTVVVGTANGKVIAVDVKTGNIRWEASTASEILAEPALADDVVFVHSLDGSLTALNENDGRQLWRFALQTPPLILRRSAAPVVTKKHVIVGFANGKVAAIQRLDGTMEWVKEISNPKGRSDIQRMIDISSTPVVDNGIVYVASYQGNLAALAIENGRLLWERPISSYAGIAVGPKSVFVSTTSGHVVAVDKQDGGIRWKSKALTGRRLSKPVIYKGKIIVGDDDGLLHWFSSINGAIQGRYHLGKGIEAEPRIEDHQMYVLTKDGQLSALSLDELKV